MRSAVLCHASADASFAHELAGFLETNLRFAVALNEGVVRPGYDLVDAAEQGLSADLALVLLSRASVPAVWTRSRWEPVLLAEPRELGTIIVFLLLDDCKFPELLRRAVFFDLRPNRLEGQRALKRWWLSREQPVPNMVVGLPHAELATPLAPALSEELRREIADRPGARSGLAEESALAFVQHCREDFEGVFWIDCVRRSRAGIIGDIAQALGLRLPGTLEQNRNAVHRFLADRRCLLVFANIRAEDRELVSFAGRTSSIFVESESISDPCSLEEVANRFGDWVRNPEACLDSLGSAHYWLVRLLASGEPLAAALRLGGAITAFMRNSDRLAEAQEILEMLAQATRAAGDLFTAHRLDWEQSWIRERWGEPFPVPQPPPMDEPKQLDLGFGE